MMIVKWININFQVLMERDFRNWDWHLISSTLQVSTATIMWMITINIMIAFLLQGDSLQSICTHKFKRNPVTYSQDADWIKFFVDVLKTLKW